MRVTMDCGRQRLEFEAAEGNRIACPAPPVALADPAAAVRAALEAPHGFPPLRRALTPDDHVAVVVDERLPRLGELLAALLEHVTGAGVAAERITLLCAPSSSRQPWLDDLPDALEEVHLEVHDPANRKRLSYLATMRDGRRLYLNRTVVDAEQTVVLSGRRYDPLLGHAGAEGSLYPALSDADTRAAMNTRANLGTPDAEPWLTRREAVEAAWLLGAPFFVQVIEAAGDEVAEIVAGAVAGELAEAGLEGQRRQDACWRWRVDRAADLVVASLAGDPDRQTFADLAAAAACAARVVRPGGRVALLCQARPDLADTEAFRNCEGPQDVLERLGAKLELDHLSVLRWAAAARQAHLYLLSELTDEVVEDLFATPLQQAGQVQRLLDAGGSCLFLQDAHKAIVEVD
jgi:nickel-dependent lactate racemase